MREGRQHVGDLEGAADGYVEVFGATCKNLERCLGLGRRPAPALDLGSDLLCYLLALRCLWVVAKIRIEPAPSSKKIVEETALQPAQRAQTLLAHERDPLLALATLPVSF